MRLLFAASSSVTLVVLVAIHGAQSGMCDFVAPKKKLEKLYARLVAEPVSQPGKLGLRLTHFD